MKDWSFLAAGMLGWIALYAYYWPRARAARRAAEAKMAVYCVGWSQAEAWPFYCAALAVAGSLVAGLFPLLDLANFASTNAGHYELVAFLVAGATWAVGLPIWKLHTKSVARRPFVTVTSGGISTPTHGAVGWGQILSFYSGNANSSVAVAGTESLYYESRATASAPQRFVTLCNGFENTSFLIDAPDGNSTEASWQEVAKALERQQSSGADVRPSAAGGSESAFSVLQSGHAGEIRLPHSPVQRALFGLLGAAIATIVAAPWVYSFSSGLAGFELMPLGVVAGIALVALLSLDVIVVGLRWMLAGLKNPYLLLANAAGLHHYRLGLIPWEDVHRLATHEFKSGHSDDDGSHWLCAHVTEAAYRRGRRRLGMVERLWLWSARKHAGKWALPLVSMGDGNRIPYSVNGISMPGESMDAVTGFLSNRRPAKS